VGYLQPGPERATLSRLLLAVRFLVRSQLSLYFDGRALLRRPHHARVLVEACLTPVRDLFLLTALHALLPVAVRVAIAVSYEGPAQLFAWTGQQSATALVCG
jgi:hypothetical protein